MRKHFIQLLTSALLLATALIVCSCTTEIEESPQPGVLRVTLHSDPADTQIVILSQTFNVTEKDYFGVTIFQGKVFSGEKFSFLYKDKNNPRQEDVTYNILERTKGQYSQFTIFESYVPPGDYNKLQFGVTGSLVKLGYLEIPVRLPEGTSSMKDLEKDFKIYENQVTEIEVQISPFRSVKRYRDSYIFTREMQIMKVAYLQ